MAKVGALPHPDDLTPREHQAAWTPYREAMRAVAGAHGAPVIEGPALYEASGLDVASLFLDEMHPTATGHALLAAAVVQALRPWSEGATLRGPARDVVLSTDDPFAGRGPR